VGLSKACASAVRALALLKPTSVGRRGLIVAAAFAVGACARGDGGSRSATIDPKTGTSASARVVAEGQPVPKGAGRYKIGAPYKIAGRWYTPNEDPNYDRQGRGSWYGTDFHGRKTANGEVFDMNALTAAHPTIPLPSYVYVTNLANNRTVLVRVNDRGPYANDRIIDMSRASARALGFENQGITQVRVKYAGRAPLDGNDYHERQFLAQQGLGRNGSSMGPAMSLGVGGLGLPPVTRPPRAFSPLMASQSTAPFANPFSPRD
jgi:rare lipoprotein A